MNSIRLNQKFVLQIVLSVQMEQHEKEHRFQPHAIVSLAIMKMDVVRKYCITNYI